MATRRHDNFGCVSTSSRRGLRWGGFTLVELLVVVAIIVVLISILLPSLRKSIRQASATVCMHNLRQLGQAIDFYKLDNNGWVPITDGADDELSTSLQFSVWYEKLVPTYLNDPAILVCPEDPLRPWLLNSDALNSYNPASVASSYGMNELILASPGQYLCNLDRYRPRWALTTLLVADTGPDVLFSGHTSSSMLMLEGSNRRNGLLPWDDNYEPGAPSDHKPWITERHLGGMHVLMLGENVQKVATRSLMGETIKSYYPRCAAGDCALCIGLKLPHYSFASSQVYWWTGPVPAP